MNEQFESQPAAMGLRARIDALLNDFDSANTRYLNLALVLVILTSVLGSMLLTVKSVPVSYHGGLKLAEQLFVAIFLIEYLARIYSARNRLRYLFSAYGLIDMVAILPALFFGANETFALRLIRAIALFRSLKLLRYAQDVQVLLTSLGKSSIILIMMITGIVLFSLIGGNIIYLVEPEHFASAFEGTWWSLVTMSTVGYGDYVPHSAPGRVIAGCVMIAGIVLFAVVTGLISSRILEATHMFERVHCRSCHSSIEQDSNYCSQCGIEKPWRGMPKPVKPETDT